MCRIFVVRGIPHTILERRDQRERSKERLGRPSAFDVAAYVKRNVAERLREPAQAAAWGGAALRKVGGQLHGDGNDRHIDGLLSSCTVSDML